MSIIQLHIFISKTSLKLFKIDCWLKSHEQYFSYIHHENKFQTIPPLGNFYICQHVTYLSIGVTAKCFVTSKEPGGVTYSLEPLIYVQSEGRVVYLIRPTQPGDSYFGSDFTHFIYWVLHTIFSYDRFRQCIFVKYEK
jgi:hypothetical protein